ncbi:MAG: hypothetical protein SGJ27_02330 [Candidatus Melainabacteria bacterium]|nr:hypothetical protein [Candidatus Melainabacteria bacterium]
MSSEIENEVPAARAGADSTAFSNVQADVFKGFENFTSVKSAMTDTTSSALPSLELVDDSKTSGTDSQGEAPKDRRNEEIFIPGAPRPGEPRAVGQQDFQTPAPPKPEVLQGPMPDDGSKDTPRQEGVTNPRQR